MAVWKNGAVPSNCPEARINHENFPSGYDETSGGRKFFDPGNNSISYLVKDPESNACKISDSVLDIDFAAGHASCESVDKLLKTIVSQGPSIRWTIETHRHADRLFMAVYLQEQLGIKTGGGARILEVQNTFGKVLDKDTEFPRDSSQLDGLFEDDACYSIGNLQSFAIATPIHMTACMLRVIDDDALAGDTLFIFEGGSARTDFPSYDAGRPKDSFHKVLALSYAMRFFLCRDYKLFARAVAQETTIGDQRCTNIHVRGGRLPDEFVEFHSDRGEQSSMSKLTIPSPPTTMHGGGFPCGDTGKPILETPINSL